MANTEKDRASTISELHAEPTRSRRARYVFGVTIACFVIMLILVAVGADTQVAQIVAEGMVAVLGTVVVTYLATSTVDRAELLTNFGIGARKFGENRSQVIVQTPDQARRDTEVMHTETTTTTSSPSEEKENGAG